MTARDRGRLFSFTSRDRPPSLYCLRMSLWRVKHTLSPVVEYALVVMVAVYGLFGIYMAAIRPLVVASTVPVTAVPEPVPLDPELWFRRDNVGQGYAYAVPPGWQVDDGDLSAVRIGRSVKEMGMAGREGDGLLVETVPLYEGKTIVDAAASDFAFSRPALYDVSVDGRLSLFAVEFDRGRVARQVAYVPMGDRALVVRAADLDPAVFAMFLTHVRFYSSEEITPTP